MDLIGVYTRALIALDDVIAFEQKLV